jgi:HSP20 family protein
MALDFWKNAFDWPQLVDNTWMKDPFFAQAGKFRPAMDLKEDENSYIVTAELPGVSQDDIKVELKNNTVSISGEKKTMKEEDRDNYHVVERSSGSFCRRMRVPPGTDDKHIQANLKDGILEVRVQKLPAALGESKAIPISQ